MSYKINCIENIKDFEALESIWKGLEKACDHQSISSSFDFQVTWFKSFETEEYFNCKKHLKLLILLKKDEIIGIAPFVKTVRKTRLVINRTTIEFLGQQFGATYLDFIGKMKAEEVEMFFSWIQKNEKYDYLLIKYIPEWSVMANVLNKRSLLFSACPVIRISDYKDYEDYRATVYDANFRHNLKRRRKKLEKEYQVEFMVSHDVQTTEDLDSIVSISNSKNEDNKHSHYSKKGIRNYITSLLKATDSFIVFLNIDNTPVAYQVCIRYAGTVFFIDFSYDRKFRNYGLGNILEDYVIGMCFNDKNNVCLGTGIDYYKTKFSRKFTALHSIYLPGNTPLSILFSHKIKRALKGKEQRFITEIEGLNWK